MIDTLTFRLEGTGHNFTRSDVLAMEMGEVLFYLRQSRRHHEEITEARRRGNSGGSEGSGGKYTETHTDGWAEQEDDENRDEDEDVSVETLLDE